MSVHLHSMIGDWKIRFIERMVGPLVKEVPKDREGRRVASGNHYRVGIWLTPDTASSQ